MGGPPGPGACAVFRLCDIPYLVVRPGVEHGVLVGLKGFTYLIRVLLVSIIIIRPAHASLSHTSHTPPPLFPHPRAELIDLRFDASTMNNSQHAFRAAALPTLPASSSCASPCLPVAGILRLTP